MGNCLVTKLKSSVQNDSLPYIGKVRVFCKTKADFVVANRRINCLFSEDTTVTSEGVQFTTNSGTPLGYSIVVPADTAYSMYISNGNGVVYIPKYNVKSIETYTDYDSFDININDYPYFGCNYNGRKNIDSKASGNVDALKGIQFELLKLNGSEITGDLSNLDVSTTLTLENTKCTGEITSSTLTSINIRSSKYISINLNNFTNVTSLLVNESRAIGSVNNVFAASANNMYVANCPNVTGSVETVIENLWNLNKRSGAVTMQVIGSGVTYHADVQDTPYANVFRAEFTASGVTLKDLVNSQQMATYDPTTGWTYNI